MSKKIDHETIKQIKHILSKYNIDHDRILIDLQKETVETEEDYSVEDLLEVAGTLTSERGNELMNEVNKAREEWDE